MSVVQFLKRKIEAEKNQDKGGFVLPLYPIYLDDPDQSIPLESPYPDPEITTHKILNWERLSSLSEEAQYVVNLILNSPFETFQSSGRIPKGKIRERLSQLWPRKIVEMAWREVRDWVRDF